METFAQKFSVDPQVVEKYLPSGCADFEKSGAGIMDFEQYGIFTYTAKKLGEIRDALSRDADNIVYAYMLKRALSARDDAGINALSSPNRRMESELFDTLPMFSLLACVPDMCAEHRRLGIPDEVTGDTCGMFENQLQDFIDLNRRFGISAYVGWLRSFLECRILRVGRFNLEICTYDAPYDVFCSGGRLIPLPKGVRFHESGQVLGSIGCTEEEKGFFAEAEVCGDEIIGFEVSGGVCAQKRIRVKAADRVLTRGDRVVSVHIPSGGPLREEICSRDLARGEEIMRSAFGDFSAFYCHSWLMDTQLESLAGEGNISKFARRFTRFPMLSDGKEVFEYVYLLPADTPADQLPENTRLAREVKKHLLSGGHIYSAAGVFLTRRKRECL